MQPLSVGFLALLLWTAMVSAAAKLKGSQVQGAPESDAELVFVTTLTRHGSRAPDKILATVSCKPLFERTRPDQSLTKMFVSKFGTIPGELTYYGEEQMQEVGKFIKRRYGKNDLDFIDTDNYVQMTKNWEFVARAGSRQQRSMMAISQGIFPGTAVPISVTDRKSDAVLGGPAAQCGSITAKMIVDWHSTTGKELVKASYAGAVEPFEKLCNVSLRDNPVNAAPGGPNPHAWVGDVSDLLDSIRENLPASKQPAYSQESFDALTDLAFQLEQRSHYDDPRGQVMFAGEFPNLLLSTFEGIAENNGKRPKATPKMRLYACSRELEYGLSHMFDWERTIRLPGQPTGRVLPGSTIIWELWKVDGKYYIDTLMYQPGENGLLELQERTTVDAYRKEYEDAINSTGNWQKVCNVRDPEMVKEETHSSNFWVVLGLVVVLALALAYRGGFRRGGYQTIS